MGTLPPWCDAVECCPSTSSRASQCIDELGSPFRPRTTKTGDLPYLTMKPKPEPLCTMFKCGADGPYRNFQFLELQKGKAAMQALQFQNEMVGQFKLGSNAVCTVRLVTAICEANDFAVGYSWFGSVPGVVKGEEGRRCLFGVCCEKRAQGVSKAYIRVAFLGASFFGSHNNHLNVNLCDSSLPWGSNAAGNVHVRSPPCVDGHS